MNEGLLVELYRKLPEDTVRYTSVDDKIMVWQSHNEKSTLPMQNTVMQMDSYRQKGQRREYLECKQRFDKILGENSGIDKASISGFILKNHLLDKIGQNEKAYIYGSMSEYFIDMVPDKSFNKKDKKLIQNLFNEMERNGLYLGLTDRGYVRIGSTLPRNEANNIDPLLPEIALSIAFSIFDTTNLENKKTMAKTENWETYASLPTISEERINEIKELLQEIREKRIPQSTVSDIRSAEPIQVGYITREDL